MSVWQVFTMLRLAQSQLQPPDPTWRKCFLRVMKEAMTERATAQAEGQEVLFYGPRRKRALDLFWW